MTTKLWSRSIFERFVAKLPGKEEDSLASGKAQIHPDLEHLGRREYILIRGKDNLHELDEGETAKPPGKEEESLTGGKAQLHLELEHLVRREDIFVGDEGHFIKDNKDLMRLPPHSTSTRGIRWRETAE